MITFEKITNFVVIFSIGFALSAVLVIITAKNSINGRAIERGYAEYNSTTGNLQYLDKDVKYLIYGEEE